MFYADKVGGFHPQVVIIVCSTFLFFVIFLIFVLLVFEELFFLSCFYMIYMLLDHLFFLIFLINGNIIYTITTTSLILVCYTLKVVG